jgi:hypothetical protein
MKSSSRAAFGVLLALALLIHAAFPALAGEAPPAIKVCKHPCAGSLGVPLSLEPSVSEKAIAVGGMVNMQALVRAQTNLQGVVLFFKTSGAAELAGPVSVSLGSFSQGQEKTVLIPVKITRAAASTVSIRLTANDAVSGALYEKTEELNTIFSYGRAYAGWEDPINLQLRSIQDASKGGQLTIEDTNKATREALALTGQFDETPQPGKALSPDEQRMSSDILPAVPTNVKTETAVNKSGECITVQGHVSWVDENGLNHPAYGMSVEIWDSDPIVDEFIKAVATDVNGDYSTMVDNNDGIGQGDRDIYVKFVTQNNAVRIHAPGSDPFEASSSVHNETPCGATITENFTAANTGTGPSVNLVECGSYIAVYAKDRLNGGSFLGQLNIEWPGSTGSANYNGSRINLRPGDRWDWDVEMHEYGHYIQDVFDIEDNPGGPHNIGDCISDVHSSKSEGVRMAFGEGWPTYDGTVAQQVLNLASLNVPRVGDVSYTDTGESNFTYSLESQDNNGIGEDNEVAIQRIFWDWFDTNSDSRDNVSMSDIDLFQFMAPAHPTTFSAAWAAIKAHLSPSDFLGFGAVTTDHQVGPALVTPVANAVISPANANFSWQRKVGCSSTYAGDGFTLRFFNAATSAPILSFPVGNTTSASLTLAQLQTLVASSHSIKWAVEGSNSSDPATGPYLGENRAITVNRPPVANAGPDQPAVECASHTTTAVQLNGTGSSDPDGDPLTYTWSAPGVTFNNNHSATPIGQFPMGTTVATLSVSDGLQSDTNQVSITVVDTTPPVITCPNDVVVECSSHCGTSKTDPQLTAFFAAASATDVCDASPTLTNDAPNCFADGTTTVTFTAKDDDNNTSQCTAKVKVQDTTPPVINVVLSRDVLWPPNHKLSTITANVTVTDICDPNPTFVLTSITSNEPDNGLGDGDTANDIQGTNLGTADTQFQLRSERAGTGTGRVYTITYTASDVSGNTAQSVTTVRVPHNQMPAPVVPARGFSTDGVALAITAPTYQLVVLSNPMLDPRTIDPASALVGNQVDAIRPVASRLQDVNGDHWADLILTYSVPATQAILAQADPLNPVGLDFTFKGLDFLAPNIFRLGSPMVIPTSGGVSRDPSTAILANGPQSNEETQAIEQVVPAAPQDLSADGASFTLPAAGRVTIEVFNIAGRKVRTLMETEMSSGRHDLVVWDGRGDGGRRLPSGIYLYRIAGPGVNLVKKYSIVR